MGPGEKSSSSTKPPAIAVLYLSYDGMLEPLGESQVVAYLVPLARDHDVRVPRHAAPDSALCAHDAEVGLTDAQIGRIADVRGVLR